MRVSLNWLKEYLPNLTATPEEIEAKLTSGGIEVDVIEYLENGDTVLELDLTPNRSDCLSMRGVVVEVAALFDIKPCFKTSSELPVRVDVGMLCVEATEACPHYLALLVDDLRIGDSPVWIAERLLAAGMRPINNIVDLANLVMLELGEPLHTFDYDALSEQRIVVRQATDRERIRTLDQQERELNTETLLICDGRKPVAIAGVMGDALTEVTPNTKRLLVEAACFERRSIRRTSKILGLRSEAALRFEKGVDPVALKQALQRFAELIRELGYGNPQEEIFSAGPFAPQATREIELRREKLFLISGLQPSDFAIESVLRRLGFDVRSTSVGWLVTVPTWRQDLWLEVDLIEEVARLIGFAQLEAKLPEGPSTLGVYTETQQALRLIRQRLIQCGLNEILNYSFVDVESKPHQWLVKQGLGLPLIPILNPLSQNVGSLRASLLPSMLQTILYNLNHQSPNLKLFEIGAVFQPKALPLEEQPIEEQRLLVALTGNDHLSGWNVRPQEMDFYSVKGILEQLSLALNLDFTLESTETDLIYHPYRVAKILLDGECIGCLGELHPDLLSYCEIEKHVVVLDLNLSIILPQVRFLPQIKPSPRYPYASRDLALIVPRDLPAIAVLNLIRSCGGELLEQVRLFDDYRGGQLATDQKSLAFSIIYRSPERTLTDAEVSALHQQIVERVGQELGARQRS